MSSHGLYARDALSSYTPKAAVVVQVDELSINSSSAEATTEILSQTVEGRKSTTVKEEVDLELFSQPVIRHRTTEMAPDASVTMPASLVQRSSSYEILRCPRQEEHDIASPPPRRRALRMQLPSFRSLGIASSDSGFLGRHTQAVERLSSPSTRSPVPNGRGTAHSVPLPSSENIRRHNLGSAPLLTPPEDADSIKWNNAFTHSTPSRNPSEPPLLLLLTKQAMTASSEEQQGQLPPLSASQPLGESSREPQQGLGTFAGHNTQEEDDGTPLSRAVRVFISAVVRPEALLENIHFIAQVLPQPALNMSQSKPAFEEVVEAIQARQTSDEVAYITLTHAVPPKFEMKDLPTSPPATPNPAQGRDDYFGQTIFTNAATVSTYHGHKSLLNSQAPPSPNTIVAPSSIQLCVLERYVPPTSPLEYGDFFDSRSHSILVDRLAELSVHHGRLLLLYPTRAGAETFMSSYLNPIMDPFLREFIFLNNLYFQLGTMLGSMSAVSIMLDFEEMEHRLRGLCRAISRKASFRGGPSSTFTLVHSERGASTIDTKSWKQWYVDQEMARIKENLYEYAKMGGRMPPEVNHHQITPSVLARQVVDGIQDSNRVSGGAPIELGLFVIERTRNS